MRMITILTAALIFLVTGIFAEKSVDLRLNPSSFDEAKKVMYVDIELRFNQSGQFNLAGQNFRLYYNSESLHLDSKGSTSRLPKNTYGALNIVDNFEGVAAEEVNQIAFDDNLGFVNVSIDLKANDKGGVTLERSDDWIAVARLKFNVRETLDDYEIVWGRQGMTDKYATAFVEVSEWIAPFDIKTVAVEYYEDLSIPNETEFLVEAPTVSVGPNPTSEFIQVEFSKPVLEDGTMMLRDVTGRAIIKVDFQQGAQLVRIDLSGLSPSNYFLDVSTEKTGMAHLEKIIITK